MMKLSNLLSTLHQTVFGDFSNLDKFDFPGVYIICDGDEVVYIGSAYARNIGARLKQYLNPKDSGNTLGKSIAKRLTNQTSFNDVAKEKMDDAVKKIQSFMICAIKHEDLEYQLISLAKPLYNNYGKDED